MSEPLLNHHILMAMNTASQGILYTPYLQSRGCTVRSVYTARDLGRAANTDHVDLVLMDLTLRDQDALSATQMLRAQNFDGPVIIILPHTAGDPAFASQQRHVHLLRQPFSVIQLYETISTLLKDRSSQAASFPENIAGHIKPAGTEPPPTARTQAQQHQSTFGGFIGTSAVMQNLYERIQSAARSTATVFITGESGTGKEVCAQAIHKHGACADKVFIPLNCAAIPRDLLESELFGHTRGAFTGAVSDRDGAAKLADGGTLFLDEIGDMDPLMQTKLLRYLQDGTFQRVGGSTLEHSSARIICATNRDPMADVRSGRMREDLFYRLHVLPIIMPPLRMREDDILDIAQTLLVRFSFEEKKRFKAFAEDAENILRHYDWPGNIRQLQNVIRHAVVMHDGVVLTARMLPLPMLHRRSATDMEMGMGAGMDSANDPVDSFYAPPSLGQLDGSTTPAPKPIVRRPQTVSGIMADQPIIPLHILERREIERALRLCRDNIPRAAALLQVSPSTIYRKKTQWDEEDLRAGRSSSAQNPAETMKNTDNDNVDPMIWPKS